VDGAEVGVLEKADEVRLGGLLKTIKGKINLRKVHLKRPLN
jgi:hypothetical protein